MNGALPCDCSPTGSLAGSPAPGRLCERRREAGADPAAAGVRHVGVAIDALALSAEFLARAAVEQPEAYASLALVSPIGFSGSKQRHGAPGSTRGMPWLCRTLSWSTWDDGIYGLLTRPGTIRYFLERT